MNDMEKIIQGLSEFQKKIFEEKRDLFENLRDHQDPRVLFITCSDSRIDPSLITQSEPGELFVLRNAGHIIPPHGAESGIGQEATIDYAIHHLGVQHIILCGHTDCGAVKALLNPPHEGGHHTTALNKWLYFAESTRQIADDLLHEVGCCQHDHDLSQGYQGDEAYVFDDVHPEKVDAVFMKIVQTHVKMQLQHLKTIPSVARAISAGTIRLHGWVYCLHSAEIWTLDEAHEAFRQFEISHPLL